MEVKLSRRAQYDLDKIAVYSEEMWGTEQRIKTGLQLKNTLEFLENYPDCGHATSKIGIFIVMVPKLPFVFLYRLSHSKIIVLQVLHSKQNIK